MLQLVTPLASVALLILLGWALRRLGFLPAESWPPIERLVYFVLFPALLFLELARADFTGLPVFEVGGVLIAAQLSMAAAASAVRRQWQVSGESYSSAVQGVVRWNSYVFFALVPGLFGAAAVPLGAVAVAAMVPLANLLSVAALARYGRARVHGFGGFLRAMASNPLVVATLAGVAWNQLAPPLPEIAAVSLETLGKATLSLGLLTVGAGLRTVAMPGSLRLVTAVSALKLLVKPLLAFALGSLLGLGGAALGVIVLATAVPTATSAYILARILGGDAELMAAIITITTLLALLTMPLMLLLVT
ncbi:AEC family transporter [Geminicoccaceae bacterium 1502E]|nr:AEC family transporter [Geminicoccaceae bacterium 1502E]